ncbi:DUF924 domain-containing protein [Seongchinamella unica]|uniref:DUF924 domain-containing protein n=1 Tax=Seongchinamella unica TaxID=2547392 RepID=A0A4R5LQQ8_9GAMM|nr:DUF924 family protein [Seongchinamella unica]TDG12934.1 DUF924 domain-containing protein [Seongchinamella unica]
MQPDIAQIHDFWFGPLTDEGMCAADRHDLWFRASDSTDRLCRDRFGLLVTSALEGQLADWPDSDPGLIALVLLLDQFTRNIYRGTPQAFAGDERALALAQHCIAHGHHQRLPAIHQVFLFMPLEHCENLEVQDECVELFTQLQAITGLEQVASFCRYAIAHRDVIAQFGRFPHRNAILGRDSTPGELNYLEQHGGF